MSAESFIIETHRPINPDSSAFATRMMTKIVGIVAAASSFALLGEAFSPSFHGRHCTSNCIPSSCQTVVSQPSVLWSTGSSGGGKKKRRRRKQPPTSTDGNSPETTSSIVDESLQEIEVDGDDDDDDEPIDIALIKDVAKFKFDGEISAPGRFDYP